MTGTTSFRALRLGAAALALGVFGIAGIGAVHAQDATPDASTVLACDSPGLTAEEAAAALASPIATESDATSSDADDATAETIFDAVTNYFACYDEGQASGDPGLYIALESSNFVASQGFATRDAEVQAELGSPFATATLLDIDTPLVWSDGRMSADVQAMIGTYWYNEWRWFLVEEDGILKVDARVDLPPQPDVDFVAVNGINMTDAFESSSGSWDFTETDAVILNVTNSGAEARDVVVLELPEGIDPAGLLDGTLEVSTDTVVAAAFGVQPEATVNITMIDLPVGAYFLYSPNGAGMVQPFNIVAPAEG